MIAISVRRLALAAVLTLLTTQLRADVILPSGLPVGSQYQILFLTSGSISATSGNIADYNNFVTQQATLAPGDIGDVVPAGTTWSAVISTSAAAANTNAPVFASVPVYDTQGNLISSTDIYTAFSINPIKYGQSGSLQQSTFAWTGSDPDGNPEPGAAAGETNPIIGLATSGTAWLYFSNSLSDETPVPVYALSAPITVSASVPEPATVALLYPALLSLGGLLLLRRWGGAKG